MFVTETRLYKRLIRMRDLAVLFQVLLPAAAAGFVSALAESLDTLAALAGNQKAAATRLSDLARAKGAARDALKADLQGIHRLASALALETPGIDAKFTMPLPGDAKLLVAARSFAEVAAPLSELFIKNAMPASFLDDLNAHMQAFDQAIAQYVAGSQACNAAATAIEKTMADAVKASACIDATIRNTLVNDGQKIAEWDLACEFGRSKTKPKKPPVIVKPDNPAPAPLTPEVVSSKVV
jgi:hypothetical protein